MTRRLRLVKTGREPSTASLDEAAAASPSLSRGVAPPTDEASRPDSEPDEAATSGGRRHRSRPPATGSEPFFCADPFGEWINSILEDKERDEEL